MKRQVRRGVFETNSSSVHSITMCTSDEYDKWVNGELLWDYWNDKLIKPEDRDPDEEDDNYYTYDDFYEKIEYETYEENFTTPKGEKIVAFGYYGHD